MSRKTVTFSVLCVFSLAVQAVASTISYSDQVALQPTDFNNAMSVSQFDPSLGTLTEVTMTIAGELLGEYGYENISSDSSYPGGTWRYVLNQQLDVTQGTSPRLSMTKGVDETVPLPSLPVFDGILDFGGTSGGTVTRWDQQQSQPFVFTAPGDLAPFIGTGSVSFGVTGTGASTHYEPDPQGPVTMTGSYGGASVDVMYDYEPVPEPGTIVLVLSGGVVCLVAYAWRRWKGDV